VSQRCSALRFRTPWGQLGGRTGGANEKKITQNKQKKEGTLFGRDLLGVLPSLLVGLPCSSESLSRYVTGLISAVSLGIVNTLLSTPPAIADPRGTKVLSGLGESTLILFHSCQAKLDGLLCPFARIVDFNPWEEQ